MKSTHVSLRFLALKTLSCMVFILAPAWAELTSQRSGQELKIASQNEEKRTAQQSRTQQTAPTLVTAKDMIADPSRIRITVNFATNQADILPQYRGQLDELGKALQQMAGLSFEIGGHTDQRGAEDHNMRLSERRSESIRR